MLAENTTVNVSISAVNVAGAAVPYSVYETHELPSQPLVYISEISIESATVFWDRNEDDLDYELTINK